MSEKIKVQNEQSSAQIITALQNENAVLKVSQPERVNMGRIFLVNFLVIWFGTDTAATMR